MTYSKNSHEQRCIDCGKWFDTRNDPEFGMYPTNTSMEYVCGDCHVRATEDYEQDMEVIHE